MDNQLQQLTQILDEHLIDLIVCPEIHGVTFTDIMYRQHTTPVVHLKCEITPTTDIMTTYQQTQNLTPLYALYQEVGLFLQELLYHDFLIEMQFELFHVEMEPTFVIKGTYHGYPQPSQQRSTDIYSIPPASKMMSHKRNTPFRPTHKKHTAQFKHTFLYPALDYPVALENVLDPECYDEYIETMFSLNIYQWYESPTLYDDEMNQEAVQNARFLFYDGIAGRSVYFVPLSEPYRVIQYNSVGDFDFQYWDDAYRIMFVYHTSPEDKNDEITFLLPQMKLIDLIYCTEKYDTLFTAFKTLVQDHVVQPHEIFPAYDPKIEYLIHGNNISGYSIYECHKKTLLQHNREMKTHEYQYQCYSPAVLSLSVHEEKYFRMLQRAQPKVARERRVKWRVRKYNMAPNKIDYFILE